MTKPVKITIISLVATVVIFITVAMIFNYSQAEVDEAAIKKDADEKATDLIDNIDSSFEDTDTSNAETDTLTQP